MLRKTKEPYQSVEQGVRDQILTEMFKLLSCLDGKDDIYTPMECKRLKPLASDASISPIDDRCYFAIDPSGVRLTRWDYARYRYLLKIRSGLTRYLDSFHYSTNLGLPETNSGTSPLEQDSIL